MVVSSTFARVARSLQALLYVLILLTGPAVAQAAQPLTAQQRLELTQVLDKLTASRTAMAAMVTECSGGTIMIIACSAPLKTAHPSGCIEAIASCDLVAALHDVDTAIEDLQKTLTR